MVRGQLMTSELTVDWKRHEAGFADVECMDVLTLVELHDGIDAERVEA